VGGGGTVMAGRVGGRGIFLGGVEV
jgi:hypothetical protein